MVDPENKVQKIKTENGLLDVAVLTKAGKLGLRADLPNKKRLAYYNPQPLPADFLLNIDGVEIGKPILEQFKSVVKR